MPNIPGRPSQTNSPRKRKSFFPNPYTAGVRMFIQNGLKAKPQAGADISRIAAMNGFARCAANQGSSAVTGSIRNLFPFYPVSSETISPAWIQPIGAMRNLSSAFPRCWSMKFAGSLQWISTRQREKKIPRLIGKPVGRLEFPPHWKDQDLAMATTYGSSSRSRSRRNSHGNWLRLY